MAYLSTLKPLRFKAGDKALTKRKISSEIGYFEQFTPVVIREVTDDTYVIGDKDGIIRNVDDDDLILNTEEEKQKILEEEAKEAKKLYRNNVLGTIICLLLISGLIVYLHILRSYCNLI